MTSTRQDNDINTCTILISENPVNSDNNREKTFTGTYHPGEEGGYYFKLSEPYEIPYDEEKSNIKEILLIEYWDLSVDDEFIVYGWATLTQEKYTAIREY